MAHEQGPLLSHIATLAALRAADRLSHAFGHEMSIQSKAGRHNLVTEWDKKVETETIEFIRSRFPDHTFLAEEGGKQGGGKGKVHWIIDPIDGTVNFAHGIPVYAVSIAATFEGEVLAGAIIDPSRDELFTAEKGQGAFLNGKRLKVTETADLKNAIAATGFPYNVDENPLKCIDLFVHFIKQGIPIRRLGSAVLDLAYLAAGRLDFFWEVSLMPWDYAAAKLLIEEAGGRFTHFDGKEPEELNEMPIIATNGLLHDQVFEEIQKVLES